MPPWMIGCSMPNSSVMAVFTKGSCRWAETVRERRERSPLFAEGTDFELKGPAAPRLLVKLPIGFCDRRRRHQKVGVVERIRPQRFQPPLADPFRIDARIDDEMCDMDVLRPELQRRRL